MFYVGLCSHYCSWPFIIFLERLSTLMTLQWFLSSCIWFDSSVYLEKVNIDAHNRRFVFCDSHESTVVWALLAMNCVNFYLSPYVIHQTTSETQADEFSNFVFSIGAVVWRGHRCTKMQCLGHFSPKCSNRKMKSGQLNFCIYWHGARAYVWQRPTMHLLWGPTLVTSLLSGLPFEKELQY